MTGNSIVEKKGKFSLIELLMVIMLVGIIFTLTIPLRNDRLNQKKMKEAIYNIQVIARADVAFKDDPANGYYIFEHFVVKLNEDGTYSGEDLLNIIDDLQQTEDFFYFDYSVTETTVVASSNKNFGKEGAKLYYYLPTGPWSVGEDKISKSVLDPNWLP